jgi:hypothetical protein
MLFRDKVGNLIEINKKDYKNDILYYRKIIEIYKLNMNKNENSFSSNNIIENDKSTYTKDLIESVIKL